MSESETPLSEPLTGVFDRLRGQLGDLATSEQRGAAATAALAKTITDKDQLKVLKAAAAHQTAAGAAATTLVAALERAQTAAGKDLAQLIAIVAATPPT